MEPVILFENNDYLVVNKPAGWISVPGRKPEPTVITQWLSDHLTRTGARYEEPFIVHRLDRFTSGVMLFAKTPETHRDANRWFFDRDVKKTYHFLAAPPPAKPAIQIREPIQGKPAQTLFEVIQRGPSAFYGKATPLTGRFHQIREHAEAAGFPIFGDPAHHGLERLTLGDGTVIEAPRVCLHAFRLELPFGAFEAPLPEDFRRTLEAVLK